MRDLLQQLATDFPGERRQPRIADALASLLRLFRIVMDRLGRELPAGLRRLGASANSGAAAALAPPALPTASPRTSAATVAPPSAVSASAADPFSASRSACSEASGGVAAPAAEVTSPSARALASPAAAEVS